MTTLLQLYDRVSGLLANISTVEEALDARMQFKLLQDYARRVRDREVLARATVLQLKSERVLGGMIEQAKTEGRLAQKKKPRAEESEDGTLPRFTLAEAGIDKKLSVAAQAAARMAEDEFNALLQETEERIRSRKAIVIDPVKDAAKAADIKARRVAHAARTKGGCCVADLGDLALTGWRAGFIGMDPQWEFLTYSQAGQDRSASVHYKTEAVDKIKAIPVRELAAERCALGMWMVDWCPRDALELGESYGFKHVTTLYTWVKTNGERFDLRDPATFPLGMGYWTRANPEDCWLFTKGDPVRLYADVRQLIFAPLMEHSRKPDEWLERSERLVEGPYLELNARRRRPGWVAWGDELEWEGPQA